MKSVEPSVIGVVLSPRPQYRERAASGGWPVDAQRRERDLRVLGQGGATGGGAASIDDDEAFARQLQAQFDAEAAAASAERLPKGKARSPKAKKVLTPS